MDGMTEVGVMTLAEFVLARVAEDEEAIRATVDITTAANGMVRLKYAWPTDGLPPQCNPARMLGECEAKRRIVATVDDPRVMCEVSDDVLRLLALLYRDHPDYRHEWRPAE